MSYGFQSGRLIVKKDGLDLKKFKADLKNLCCSDYNGDSGSDYFVEYEKNGKIYSISNFDLKWKELKDKNIPLADMAREVLVSNFESDREFYVDFNLEVIDREDEIIIFSSAMTYC